MKNKFLMFFVIIVVLVGLSCLGYKLIVVDKILSKNKNETLMKIEFETSGGSLGEIEKLSYDVVSEKKVVVKREYTAGNSNETKTTEKELGISSLLDIKDYINAFKIYDWPNYSDKELIAEDNEVTTLSITLDGKIYSINSDKVLTNDEELAWTNLRMTIKNYLGE